MYKNIGGYVLGYDEFRERCRKLWSGKFTYLCIDMARRKEGKHRIFNASKNTYIECIPEGQAFQLFK